MNDELWVWIVRCAGALHFLTVALAHFTPIPANWDAHLAQLPPVDRRFSIAQNIFIGATMVFAGVVSLVFAAELVSGSMSSRILCAGIALWWGGRLLVLPWLRVWPELRSTWLRAGFIALHVECAAFALLYGALALGLR